MQFKYNEFFNLFFDISNIKRVKKTRINLENKI